MTTVSIHEGETRGRGQLSFDNPDVAMVVYNLFIYTIVTIWSANCFPENKEKSSAGLISYPEEI